MRTITHLQCACGACRLDVSGRPLISVECCCDSCRKAGEKLAQLPGAHSVLDEKGATPFVLYRKDRVTFPDGFGRLKAYRLSDKAPTRRMVTDCCSTLLFLEFKGGHWLSLYGGLWPTGTLPPLELRTMTGDLPAGTILPDDVPNARSQTPSFFWKLFVAWAAMGFRSPKIPVTREQTHA